jgi:3-methylfumaryl-CoA hydratase
MDQDMSGSSLDPAQVAQWEGAVGRQEVRHELLSREDLRRYALAVGCAPDDEQPPIAHWAFFLPAPRDEEIGPDGHPRRGAFLPAITLPRRMFAAARMAFSGKLECGAEATLTSTIAGVRHKVGRTGDLVFVEVEREFAQRGEVKVREVQTYVYRGEGGPTPAIVPAAAQPEGQRWEPDEVNLFRFSAATFNGHRIHYDNAYATQVEGYPALVIHGPFTAAKLAGLAARDGDLTHFAFRAEAPLFLGQPVFLQRGEEQGSYRAVRVDGATAMTATARFA